MSEISYSVVIPMKNERDNVVALIDELEPVMNALNEPWELIAIDDGSDDGTDMLLQDLASKRDYIRLIRFDRNYGQSSAFDAGFQAATGTFVITMDGDRQNDPRDIPNMLKLVPDADLVCGIRQKRRDTASKRWISKIANAIRSRVCRDGVQDTGCSLKIFRTACLRQLKLFDGMHRFLPALFTIEGFRIKEIQVNHRARAEGTTKYTIFNRSINTIWDMLAVVWMRRRHLHYKVKT